MQKKGALKVDYWKLKKKDQYGESAKVDFFDECEGNILVVTENLTNFKKRWIFNSIIITFVSIQIGLPLINWLMVILY